MGQSIIIITTIMCYSWFHLQVAPDRGEVPTPRLHLQ